MIIMIHFNNTSLGKENFHWKL